MQKQVKTDRKSYYEIYISCFDYFGNFYNYYAEKTAGLQRQGEFGDNSLDGELYRKKKNTGGLYGAGKFFQI